MQRIIHDKRFTIGGHGEHCSRDTTKKLILRRKTLRELTGPDLQRIQGGVEPTCSVSQDNGP